MAEIVAAVFGPLQTGFTTVIAPAVGVGVVAVLGLSIAVARAKGTFKGSN